MKKRTSLLPILALSALLGACEQNSDSTATTESADTAASEAKTTNLAIGKQKYDLFCSGCHNAGDGHAGTMKLIVLKGEEQSVLLDRKDLNPEYIRFIVRDGLQEMAPFRPTEINDGDLDSLIAYILSDKSSSTTQ